MTPDQMLAQLKPAKVCEPCRPQAKQIFDFATSSGLSTYQSLLKGFCAICGRKGSSEEDPQDSSIEFFWCSFNSGHVFEMDKEAETADRIPM